MESWSAILGHESNCINAVDVADVPKEGTSVCAYGCDVYDFADSTERMSTTFGDVLFVGKPESFAFHTHLLHVSRPRPGHYSIQTWHPDPQVTGQHRARRGDEERHVCMYTWEIELDPDVERGVVYDTRPVAASSATRTQSAVRGRPEGGMSVQTAAVTGEMRMEHEENPQYLERNRQVSKTTFQQLHLFSPSFFVSSPPWCLKGKPWQRRLVSFLLLFSMSGKVVDMEFVSSFKEP